MKIKPCRLCGDKPVLYPVNAGGDGYFVACANCYNCGKLRLTKRRAIKEWNKINREGRK